MLLPTPRAILFDLDGTLTAPLLDFGRIRADMGIAAGRPILEALAEMEPGCRRQAEAILDRHEREAAAASTMNPGCEALLGVLRAREIALAVVTRNSRASAATVLAAHGLAGVFGVVIAREDAPPKPDPAALRAALRRLDVPESAAWMVGDGAHDIDAAHAAGVPAILLDHGRPDPHPSAAPPTRTVYKLLDILHLLPAGG